jgi:hypothetical protein
MNPESHRLYHRERDADAERRLGNSALARAVERPPRCRRLLLRILARLRRPAETGTVSDAAPDAPAASAPR